MDTDRMLGVLPADDSHKEVSLLKNRLLAAGYDVVEVAISAATPLDRVAAVRPDVIIIDTESPTRASKSARSSNAPRGC